MAKRSTDVSLTHVDAHGRPAMVDVGDKAITARSATANCKVRFPQAVADQLRSHDLRASKGSIVDTAIIAGTMAVKRTHELIPFCHPLPIDGCRLAIDWDGESALLIECQPIAKLITVSSCIPSGALYENDPDGLRLLSNDNNSPINTGLLIILISPCSNADCKPVITACFVALVVVNGWIGSSN